MTDIGIYATAPRGTMPETMKYARACLDQGKGYRVTSDITGVAEIDLREFFPGYETAHRAPPVVDDSPFSRVARVLPGLQAEDLRRALALTARLVDERYGRAALRRSLEAAVVGIFREPLTFVTPAKLQDMPRARVRAADVGRWAASEMGLSWELLTADSRCWEVAHPRQAAMWLVRRICPHAGTKMIARLFGRKDHTTVVHACRQVEARMREDVEYGDRMRQLRARAEEHFDLAVADEGVDFADLCGAYASAMRAAA